eukprot:TRINITY_DN28831_c0_g2_i2.p1 TRINITY_DN28831_c0_g2~~TRINITY_DN28831_c0_g2_i2.p1  ORF type:complete len:519 (+),score=66.38 TRINITY_DN28831_c0_g2_i2:88-1557(+)
MKESDVDDSDVDKSHRSRSMQDTLSKLAQRHDVDNHWSRGRIFLAELLESSAFETTVGLLIVLNLAISVYETDVSAEPQLEEPPAWLGAVNTLMFCVFLSEVCLRIMAFQSKFFKPWISWNTFDLFLVLSDCLLMLVRLFNTDVMQNGALRVLRICRAFRIVHAIRIWPFFRELYVMLHSLIGAFKAMIWSTVLLMLMLTLFGIVAVELINPLVREIDAAGGYEGCERCHRAFGTVWSSIVTCFQQVIAGDSWGLVTIPVIETYPSTAPFFVCIIVTVQFGILNLILVAIVDHAQKAASDDAQFQARSRKEAFEKAQQDLLGICQSLDSDGSGSIVIDELMVGFETVPELANQMKFLDVSKADMSILFSILDEDGNGTVQYEEFMEQLFKMQNQDMGVMLSFLRSYIQDIRKTVHSSQRKIDAQNEAINALHALLGGQQRIAINADTKIAAQDCIWLKFELTPLAAACARRIEFEYIRQHGQGRDCHPG